MSEGHGYIAKVVWCSGMEMRYKYGAVQAEHGEHGS